MSHNRLPRIFKNAHQKSEVTQEDPWRDWWKPEMRLERIKSCLSS